jgi:hypothetical protein
MSLNVALAHEGAHHTPPLDRKAGQQTVREQLPIETHQKGGLARNEIFARHGYVFKQKDLQNYFAAKPWYHADSAYKEHLSPTEKQNVAQLRDYEAK